MSIFHVATVRMCLIVTLLICTQAYVLDPVMGNLLINALTEKANISWHVYIDEAVSMFSRCQLINDVTPMWCSVHIGMTRHMFLGVTARQQHHTYGRGHCSHVKDEVEHHVLRAPFGIIHYEGQCQIKWDITTHSAFSLNISVIEFDPVLQSLLCWELHRQERDQRGIQLVIDHVDDHAEPHAIPSQLCSETVPKNILVSSHRASVRLVLHFNPPPISMYITYQITTMLPILRRSNDTVSYPTNVYEGITLYPTYYWASVYLRKFQPPLQYLRFGDTFAIILNIRTFMLWRVQAIYKGVCKSGQVNSTFVDGHVDLWDSQSYFSSASVCQNVMYNKSLRRKTQNADQTDKQAHHLHQSENEIWKEEFHSTMNEAAIIVRHHGGGNVWVQIYFSTYKDPCTSPNCHMNISAVKEGEVYPVKVISHGTEWHNLTYYIPKGLTSYSLALNVTVFNLNGVSTYLCDYGGVLMMYKEATNMHLPLGMYCSQGAIVGLLKAAKPLHLGHGSLSIIIKNRAPINTILFSFILYTSPCRGIISSHYRLQQSIIVEMSKTTVSKQLTKNSDY